MLTGRNDMLNCIFIRGQSYWNIFGFQYFLEIIKIILKCSLQTQA